MRLIAIFLLSLGVMAGCYQAHSDDDMRTVPVTNNPLLIHDSQKTALIPGTGY